MYMSLSSSEAATENGVLVSGERLRSKASLSINRAAMPAHVAGKHFQSISFEIHAQGLGALSIEFDWRFNVRTLRKIMTFCSFASAFGGLRSIGEMIATHSSTMLVRSEQRKCADMLHP